jgi:hypothetical protein
MIGGHEFERHEADEALSVEDAAIESICAQRAWSSDAERRPDPAPAAELRRRT